MPSIREYDKRLASFKSSLKMTKTMKMVSASKLRKAQQTQRGAQLYAQHLNAIIARLAAAVGAEAHPLLTLKENPKRALVLLVTSDKGLCGGFNNNLIRATQRWMKAPEREGREFAMSFCGKRGYMYFRSRAKVLENFEDVTAKPNFTDAARVSKHLMREFAGDFDEVYVVYNKFVSPLKQEPSFQKILPIDPQEFADVPAEENLDYIYEPAESELVDELIPRTVEFKVFYSLLENSAGEHGARMTAMDNATSNAEDLIEQYTLLRNRARQANITTELTEIISGAEAL